MGLLPPGSITQRPQPMMRRRIQHYGFGPRVIVQPNDVVSGNRVIGRDPDPFILRHYDSGWPDP